MNNPAPKRHIPPVITPANGFPENDWQTMLAIRVRPYYLHQMDPVAGTAHFRVPIRNGLALMRSLRGHMSGLCVPQYMIDLPGGGGKIPLLPDYAKETGEDTMVVENYRGERFTYPPK